MKERTARSVYQSTSLVRLTDIVKEDLDDVTNLRLLSADEYNQVACARLSSFQGGLGSGLASCAADEINDAFKKKVKLEPKDIERFGEIVSTDSDYRDFLIEDMKLFAHKVIKVDFGEIYSLDIPSLMAMLKQYKSARIDEYIRQERKHGGGSSFEAFVPTGEDLRERDEQNRKFLSVLHSEEGRQYMRAYCKENERLAWLAANRQPTDGEDSIPVRAAREYSRRTMGRFWYDQFLEDEKRKQEENKVGAPQDLFYEF